MLEWRRNRNNFFQKSAQAMDQPSVAAFDFAGAVSALASRGN
jgi:hypothetical protein